MSAVPKSPDALELRGKPFVGPRLGKRAALVAGVILLGMVALIIYNVESRKETAEAKPQAAEGTAHLQASTGDAEALSRNVSLEVRAGRDPVVDLGAASGGPESRSAPPAGAGSASPAYAGDSYAVPDLAGDASGYNAVAAQEAQEQLRLAQEAARIELDARARPTSVQGWSAPSSPSNGGAAPLAGQGVGPAAGAMGGLAEMPDLAQMMAQAGGMGGMPGAAPAPSDKERKEEWLRGQQELEAPILAAIRRPPATPFELKTGHVINAVLLQGINTDLPGDVTAMVTDNVYDTATGRHLLIPAWTKLYGRYNADVAFGQGRVPVLWSRLIFPDGSTLELGGMQATDTAGFAGMGADVDNHYGRLIGFAALSSVMGAGVQLSQPQEVGPNGQLTNRQIVAGELGREISQLGVELTRRNMRVQPTLTQQPGYRFAILVNRDVIFATPYVAK